MKETEKLRIKKKQSQKQNEINKEYILQKKNICQLSATIHFMAFIKTERKPYN